MITTFNIDAGQTVKHRIRHPLALMVVMLFLACASLAMLPSSAHALETKAQNTDFEYPLVSSLSPFETNWFMVDPNTGQFYNASGSTGWYDIADWDESKFAWKSTQTEHSGVNRAGAVEIQIDSSDQNDYAELVCSQKGTSIYQDIATTPGVVYRWSLNHASLVSSFYDKMSVVMGTPTGTGTAQDATRLTSNGHGDTVGFVGTVFGTAVTNTGIRDHSTQWEKYSGTFVCPEGQTETRLSFLSVDSLNNASGNLLDNVTLDRAYPLFYNANFPTGSTTSGTAPTTGVDDNGIYQNYWTVDDNPTLVTPKDAGLTATGADGQDYVFMGWSATQTGLCTTAAQVTAANVIDSYDVAASDTDNKVYGVWATKEASVGIGDITLGKQLSGVGNYGDATFDFDITLSKTDGTPRTGSFTMEKSDGTSSIITFNSEGKATITGLSAGQTVTIKDIVNSDKYSITETNYTVNGTTDKVSNYWTTTWYNNTKLIIPTISKMPTAASGYSTWSKPCTDYLSSSAAVGDTADISDIAPLPTNGTSVTLMRSATDATETNPSADTTGTSALIGAAPNDSGGITLTAADMWYLTADPNFTNNISHFYLYVDYTKGSNEGTTATGTVGQKIAVTFDNAYPTHDLTVSKTATGTGVPSDAVFNYTLRLTTNNGKAISGDYPYTRSDGTTGTLSFNADGYVTVPNIASGQSFVVKNIPNIYIMTVNEASWTSAGATQSLSSNWTTSWTNSTETGTPSHESTTASFGMDADTTISFTNQNPAKLDLTVSKTATGDYAPSDATFDFNVTLTDADNKPLTGSYAYTRSDGTSGTLNLDASGTGTVTGIGNNQNFVVKDVDYDTHYTVAEKDTGDWTIYEQTQRKIVLRTNAATANAVDGYYTWPTTLSYIVPPSSKAGTEATISDLPTIPTGTKVKMMKGTESSTLPQPALNPAADGDATSQMFAMLNASVNDQGGLDLKVPDKSLWSLQDSSVYFYNLGRFYYYLNYAYPKNTTNTVSGVMTTDVTEAFTNVYNNYDLSFSKTVDGDLAPSDATFTYNVTLQQNGKPLTGSFSYTRSGSSTPETLKLDENGTGTITNIVGGQTITLAKVPAETTWSIKEASWSSANVTATPDDTWKTTWSTDQETGSPTHEGTTATGTLKATTAASFTNTYPDTLNLTINKKVTGEDAPAAVGFTFDFTLTDAAGTPLSGKYTYTDSDGTKGTLTTDENGKGSVSSINGGESFTVALPVGTQYEVAEKKMGNAWSTTVQHQRSMVIRSCTGGPIAADGYYTWHNTTSHYMPPNTKTGTISDIPAIPSGSTVVMKRSGGKGVTPNPGTDLDDETSTVFTHSTNAAGGIDLTAGSMWNIAEGPSYTTTIGQWYLYLKYNYPVETANSTTGSMQTDETLDFTNKFSSAKNLTIAKTISGINAPTDATFDFDVVLKDASGAALTDEYTYVRDDGSTGTLDLDENGKGTITGIGGGKTATILAVDNGAHYTVTEHDPGDQWTVTEQNQRKLILRLNSNVPKGTDEYVTWKTPILSYMPTTATTGTISDIPAIPANSTIKYYVDAAKNKTVDPAKDIDYTSSIPDMLFSATVNDAGGLDLAAKGLYSSADGSQYPETMNYLYACVEYNYPTQTAATGSGTLDTNMTAAFTNTIKTQDLTLSKTAQGSGAPSDATFGYALTLRDSSNNSLNGTYNVTDSTGATVKTITFTKGAASIDGLASGSSYVIKDLPYASVCTATETSWTSAAATHAMDSSWSTSWTRSTETGTPTHDGTSADATMTANTTLAFTNECPAKLDLTVSKTVVGENAPADKTFAFDVTLKDDTGTPLTGTYTYTRKDGTTGELTLNDSGTGRVSGITGSDSFTINDVPYGTAYTVTEVDPGTGWTVSEKTQRKIIVRMSELTPNAVSGYYTWPNTLYSAYTAAKTGSYPVITTLSGLPSIPQGTKAKLLRGSIAGNVISAPDPENASSFDTDYVHSTFLNPEVKDDGTLSLTFNNKVELTHNPYYCTAMGAVFCYLDYNYASNTTDSVNGTMTTDVTEAFTNTYKALSTTWTPSASKTLTGTTPSDLSATFNATVTADASTPNAPLPAASGATATTTMTAAGTQAFSGFGAITFTDAGTYKYQIQESNGTDAGMTYDKTTYLATVTVSDTSGQLTPTVTLQKVTDAEGAAITPAPAAAVSFTNSYAPASTTWTPSASKTLTGDTPDNFSSTFTSHIAADDSTPTAPVPTQTDATTTMTAAGTKAFSGFGAISYDAAGTYKYLVTETGGTTAGVTYDKSAYLVSVVVTDINGQLNAASSVQQVRDATGATMTPTAVDAATFNNSYKATAGSLAVPTVTKTISGAVPGSPTTFSFSMNGNEGTEPMPDGAQVGSTIQKTISGAGTADFGTINYTKAGTYVYTIVENNETAAHPAYTYDSSVYTLTVTVEDKDAALSATSKVTQDGADANAITFDNTYTATPTSMDPPITKTISGMTPKTDEVFSFEMTGDTGTEPLPIDAKNGVVTRTIKGSGSVEMGTITYSKVGTYVYNVHEVAGSTPGYTYDTGAFQMTVKVTDDGNGVLTAARTITRNGTNVDGLDFDNAYAVSHTVTTVKKASSSDVSTGDEITYTVTVTNTEKSPAVGVWVQDAIPANTTFKSSVGGALTDTGVNWFITSLAAGESRDLTFTVTADDTAAGKTIDNIAHMNITDSALIPDFATTITGGDSNKVSVEVADNPVTPEPTNPNAGGTADGDGSTISNVTTNITNNNVTTNSTDASVTFGPNTGDSNTPLTVCFVLLLIAISTLCMAYRFWRRN